MSRIPKHGSTVLQFVVEEAMPHSPAWRPVEWSWDQRTAIALMDSGPSSYALRVVQVVAVRLPPSAIPWPMACAIAECEATNMPGSRWCARHTPGRPANALRDGEYRPNRYAGEDFPRPRGVSP